MKISVLTPTYNRAKKLIQLYESLKKNLKFGAEIEWLIMDDGSTDNTKSIVKEFQTEDAFTIIYEYQENQGKMTALNNLVQKASGEFIIECDSDDYFTDNAFYLVTKHCKIKDDIYAYAFLKYDQNECNIGNLFQEEGQVTTMFDLYFKHGETGEKALVFNSNIRKKYSYELEHGEKFITEGRMYHKMDKDYQIIGINEPLMICEYQTDGYSKNIQGIFINNPYGYYEYFKEILQMPMEGILFKKRLYAIKHYLLFEHLTNNKLSLGEIHNKLNKTIILLLFFPSKIRTYYWKKTIK